MDRNGHGLSAGIEVDLVVVWVVEIDVISVWGIGVDLISGGSKMTWFRVGIEINLVFVSGGMQN